MAALFRRSIISRLCLVMRPYLAIAGDTIVTEGEAGDEMYQITRGAVKLESITYPSCDTAFPGPPTAFSWPSTKKAATSLCACLYTQKLD